MTRKKLKAICKTNLKNKQPHFAAVCFKEIIIFTTKKIGDNGEKQAEEYLKKLGYKVIERNWKYSRIGEIDIIAKEKDILVFVEVKYRKDTKFGYPEEAVNPKKQRTIRNVANYYMVTEHLSLESPVRFDVVAILGNEIKHIRNAF